MLIPLGLEDPPRERAFVAAIVAALLLYQAVLLMFLPGERIPASEWLRADLTAPETWWGLFLGLFRAAGPVQSFLFFLFWAVLGRGLEAKAGRPILLAVFLAGALVPLAGMRLELLAWESGYWPGLGAMLACLGLGYYLLWEAEVKFFYFFPTPFAIPLGIGTTAALFVMMFFHLVVVLMLIEFYHKGGPLRPPGTPTALWALVLPLAVLVLCLIAGRAGDMVRKARQRAAAVAA